MTSSGVAADTAYSARETTGWESIPLLEIHHGRIHCGEFSIFVFLQDVEEGHGLLVVTGSHRSEFVRPTTAHCAHASCRRVVSPIRAGDAVLLPAAALTRGMPSGEQVFEFRYGFHFSGPVPAELPRAVSQRLSGETKALMEYAHVLHTKPLAAEWVKTFYPRL